MPLSLRSLALLNMGLFAAVSCLAQPGATARPAAQPAAPSALHVFSLPSGVTILYKRIPGASLIAVEEIHPLGLIHDPDGLTQGSHLVEHLRCMAATASFAPGESFKSLNAAGLANAETMGDVTHYDLVLPAQQLGLALSVIAERTTSLKPDDALIRQEAPRCYAEVDAVCTATGGPGLKFALAAAVQSWRHNRASATLRSGLDDCDPDSLAAYITATHPPGRMTIAIAGDLEPDAVLDLATRHLGEIATPPDAADDPFAPIDFAALPRDSVVTWDLDSAAVFVLYPPPADPEERLALTLWAAASNAGLAAAVGADVASPFANTHNYPVGHLPIMVFGHVPSGSDPAQAAARLAAAFEAMAANPTAVTTQARALATMLADSMDRGMDRAAFDAALRHLARRVGAEQAQRLAIGNIALEMGLLWHALGPDPIARLGALKSRDAARWERTIRRSIDADHRIITRLQPAGI